MKPDRFPLGLICGVLLSVAGYLAWANKSDWDDARIETAKSEYLFTLPVMFLGCIRYPLQSGEVFRDWHFEQPIVLDARVNGTVNDPVHDVKIINVWWDSPGQGPACRIVDTE